MLIPDRRGIDLTLTTLYAGTFAITRQISVSISTVSYKELNVRALKGLLGPLWSRKLKVAFY